MDLLHPVTVETQLWGLTVTAGVPASKPVPMGFNLRMGLLLCQLTHTPICACSHTNNTKFVPLPYTMLFYMVHIYTVCEHTLFLMDMYVSKYT